LNTIATTALNLIVKAQAADPARATLATQAFAVCDERVLNAGAAPDKPVELVSIVAVTTDSSAAAWPVTVTYKWYSTTTATKVFLYDAFSDDFAYTIAHDPNLVDLRFTDRASWERISAWTNAGRIESLNKFIAQAMSVKDSVVNSQAWKSSMKLAVPLTSGPTGEIGGWLCGVAVNVQPWCVSYTYPYADFVANTLDATKTSVDIVTGSTTTSSAAVQTGTQGDYMTGHSDLVNGISYFWAKSYQRLRYSNADGFRENTCGAKPDSADGVDADTAALV